MVNLKFYLAIGLVLVFVGLSHAGNRGDVISLVELQVAAKAGSERSQGFTRLKTELIGNIKSNDGEVAHMRFEKAKLEKGTISLIRMEPCGNFAPEDKATYLDVLPETKAIKAIEKASELDALLGKGHRDFETWFGPNGTHGYQSWACVGKDATGQLTYLRVSAEIFWDDENDVQVKNMRFSSGQLKPANPDSEIEKMIYLTGAALAKLRTQRVAGQF